MDASSQPAWIPPPPAPRWGPGRVIALVVGILLLLPAVGLLLGGGLLLWADGPARNDDGYLYSSSETFATPGYAITTARIDLATGADWLPLSAALGDARLRVAGTGQDADVFVGLAPSADVSAYLDSVDRTVVNDFGTGSAADGQRRLGTEKPATPPATQDFWTAQASGTGTQTLTWSATAGNWTLVVMNADGSSNVSVDARLGATAPALTGLAWGVLAGGVVLLLIGGLLIVLAARRRPVAPAGPYGAGVPMPAGPPPSWTPPAPVDPTSAADARAETPTSAPPQGPPTG